MPRDNYHLEVLPGSLKRTKCFEDRGCFPDQRHFVRLLVCMLNKATSDLLTTFLTPAANSIASLMLGCQVKCWLDKIRNRTLCLDHSVLIAYILPNLDKTTNNSTQRLSSSVVERPTRSKRVCRTPAINGEVAGSIPV